MAIRRDLEALERRNALACTHGGAIFSKRIRALKTACGDLGLGREAVEAIFYKNTAQLIETISRGGQNIGRQ